MAGTITWYDHLDRDYKPKCANNVDWDLWSCPIQSVCNEPGGVAHSVRSGTFWPYTIRSRVTYTCNPGYTGGETMMCQSDGKWTDRPACTKSLSSTTQQGSYPKTTTDAVEQEDTNDALEQDYNSNDKSDGSNLTLILSITGAVVYAIIMVIVVGVCWRRHYVYGRQKKSERQNRNMDNTNVINVNHLEVQTMNVENGPVYQTLAARQDDAGYTGLQKRPDAYLEATGIQLSGLPPPPYEPSDSYAEID